MHDITNYLFVLSILYRSDSGIAIVSATSAREAFTVLQRQGVYNGNPNDYILVQSKNIGMYKQERVTLVYESYTNALVAYDAIVSVMEDLHLESPIEHIKVNGTELEIDDKTVNITVPTALADLTPDVSHRTVTDIEKSIWNNKADASAIPDVSGKADRVQSAVAGHIATLDSSGNLVDSGKGISDINPLWGNIQGSIENQTDLMGALDAKYEKPSTGIPASHLASGVIPDVSSFVTNTVNNLVNYYLKDDTYTKAEVQALIGAIQQFHYEIYASTSAVTNPQGNVLYLIGPTGSGEDKYEEYVYDSTKATPWVKIGDTSIDLSNYVTTSDLNTALAAYTTSAELDMILEEYYVTADDLKTLLEEKQSFGSGTYFPVNPKEGDVFVLTNSYIHDIEATEIKLLSGYYYDYVYYTPNVAGKLRVQLDETQEEYPSDCWLAYGDVNYNFQDYDLHVFDIPKTVRAISFWDADPSGMIATSVLSFEYPAGVYEYDGIRWDRKISVEDKESWNNKYDKPVGGIPKTDLASAVRTSLGKADTAYQKPATGIPASDLAAGVIPDVTGKADKVSSPTNGNFAALDSNGNLTDSGHKHSDYLTSHQDITGKADKVSGETNGHLAALDSNGNLADSGKSASDFATAAQGAKADTALQSFTETDPTVPSWAKQSTKPSYSYSEISGTPTLATVATSGSYNDLSNKPDEVEANPTVPSGTTPAALTGLKIGNNYYDVDTGTEIITFTCGGSTYQAEDGMSWGEWVDSGYNTSYFEAESPYVVDGNGDYINYNNISQMLTDKIIASAAYSKSAVDKHAVNIVKVGNTSYSPDLSTGIVSLPAYPTVASMAAADIATAVDTAWNAVMS